MMWEDRVSEILDRVAMAIRAVVLPEGADAATDWEAIGEGARRMYRRDARAAMEAMRKPTDIMAAVYHDADPEDWLEVLPEDVWDAMITVALASEERA